MLNKPKSDVTSLVRKLRDDAGRKTSPGASLPAPGRPTTKAAAMPAGTAIPAAFAGLSEPAVLRPPVQETRLVPTLLSITKSSRALIGIKLAEVGFHNGQDELILALDEERPITVSNLANELAVRPSTVSKMLDRLFAKGLVERIGDGRDGRRTMIRVTPLGLRMKERLRQLRCEVEADLVKSVGGDDLERVAGELLRLDLRLKERLARLR